MEQSSERRRSKIFPHNLSTKKRILFWKRAATLTRTDHTNGGRVDTFTIPLPKQKFVAWSFLGSMLNTLTTEINTAH